ncbi:hypothetical protein DFR67_103442 [Williamsia limnetica]|uniref:Uncharacterized protein n=1 Tax=Williamsia limnetica TaxID=882452 RepID=A0A318S5X0_WILLI|nr:hypothetical protein DFR67_103442 [Williamsia limnetica]
MTVHRDEVATRGKRQLRMSQPSRSAGGEPVHGLQHRAIIGMRAFCAKSRMATRVRAQSQDSRNLKLRKVSPGADLGDALACYHSSHSGRPGGYPRMPSSFGVSRLTVLDAIPGHCITRIVQVIPETTIFKHHLSFPDQVTALCDSLMTHPGAFVYRANGSSVGGSASRASRMSWARNSSSTFSDEYGSTRNSSAAHQTGA